MSSSGNKLKIKTLPSYDDENCVSPIVIPEAVQGEEKFPYVPDDSSKKNYSNLQEYLIKLDKYLKFLHDKIKVGSSVLEEWDSSKPDSTGVQTKNLADGAITDAKIMPYNSETELGGLSRDKIKDGAIDSAKIANGSIQGADIAGGTITRSNLNNGIFTPYLIGTTESMSYGEVYDVSQYSFLLLCIGTKERESENSSTFRSTRILATTLIPLLPNLSGENNILNNVDHEACYRDINYLYAVQLHIYLDENNKKKCQLRINSKTAINGQAVPGYDDKGILFGIK